MSRWVQRLINLKIQVLIRSLKSSNIELGLYLNGRPLVNHESACFVGLALCWCRVSNWARESGGVQNLLTKQRFAAVLRNMSHCLENPCRPSYVTPMGEKEERNSIENNNNSEKEVAIMNECVSVWNYSCQCFISAADLVFISCVWCLSALFCSLVILTPQKHIWMYFFFSFSQDLNARS